MRAFAAGVASVFAAMFVLTLLAYPELTSRRTWAERHPRRR